MMSGKFSKLIGARTTRNFPNETDPEFVSENLEQRKSQATYVKGFKAKLRFRKDQQDIILIIKDKSAVHVSWRYHLELRTNDSQTGTSKGSGGIIGVDTKVLYKSAADGDYQAKLPQHESQTYATEKFEGKFGLQMDKQDESVLVKAEHGTVKTDIKDVGRNGGYVENLTKMFESMTKTDLEWGKETALSSMHGHDVSEAGTDVYYQSYLSQQFVPVPNSIVTHPQMLESFSTSDTRVSLCDDDPCHCGNVDIYLEFSGSCNGITPFNQIRSIFRSTVNQDPDVDLVVLFTELCEEVLTVNLCDNQVYFRHINPGDQICNESIFYRVKFASNSVDEFIWINLATLLPITVTDNNELYTNHPPISCSSSGSSTPDSDESCRAATANDASCFNWLYDVLRCPMRSHYFRIDGSSSTVTIYPADRTPTDRISKADAPPNAIIADTSLQFCVRTVVTYVEINC